MHLEIWELHYFEPSLRMTEANYSSTENSVSQQRAQIRRGKLNLRDLNTHKLETCNVFV